MENKEVFSQDLGGLGKAALTCSLAAGQTIVSAKCYRTPPQPSLHVRENEKMPLVATAPHFLI